MFSIFSHVKPKDWRITLMCCQGCEAFNSIDISPVFVFS